MVGGFDLSVFPRKLKNFSRLNPFDNRAGRLRFSALIGVIVSSSARIAVSFSSADGDNISFSVVFYC